MIMIQIVPCIESWNWLGLLAAADFTIFWQRVRFECSQSKRCIKMQHFLSFLYLLTPTDEFLFEVEYYTANNLHPFKIHVILTVCYGRNLKSDNLKYNTLGRWDDRLINQASDVPSIIFFIISCKILCKNPLF